MEFEDCGKHCRSWEFPHSGLDSGLFTCFQGAVLHWPNSNFIGVIYLGLSYNGEIQHLCHDTLVVILDTTHVCDGAHTVSKITWPMKKYCTILINWTQL